MHFSKSVVALASLAAYASAQGTPEGQVKVHVIKATAINGSPAFDPPQVEAAVGDLIQFQFHPMNHSVVRAAFADPCVPIEDSAAGNGTAGFFSGFMPVAPGDEMMPTFSIPVENEKPIWFYCSQGKHCQAGMVGVINPPADKTLDGFKSAAASAAENRSPGQESVGGGVDAPSNGTTTDPSPTTMETSTVSTTGTSTGGAGAPNATGAASKLGSSVSLVLAAVAASFFLL